MLLPEEEIYFVHRKSNNICSEIVQPERNTLRRVVIPDGRSDVICMVDSVQLCVAVMSHSVFKKETGGRNKKKFRGPIFCACEKKQATHQAQKLKYITTASTKGMLNDQK